MSPAPGRIIISLDFECGWGVAGDGAWRRREARGVYEALRPAMRRLIAQLDDLELSLTWAPVGAMIEAPGTRDLSHLRGDYGTRVREFAAEAAPATQDARDLLDLLLAARCAQGFATHGYSHVLFDDPEQDDAAIAGELERAVRANRAAGLDATRLVFPQNRAARLDAVRAAGIEVARLWPLDRGSPAQRPSRLWRAARAVLRPPGPVAERRHASGLRLHHASELIPWGEERPGIGKVPIVKWRLATALRLAAQGHLVHFWMHPYNLVLTPGLEDFLREFLFRVAALRDRDSVLVISF